MLVMSFQRFPSKKATQNAIFLFSLLSLALVWKLENELIQIAGCRDFANVVRVRKFNLLIGF